MKHARLSGLFLFAFLWGCGSEEMPGPVRIRPVAPLVSAKAAMEAAAANGQITSGLDDVQAAFEELKAAEPEKGEKLLKELEVLQKAKSPDEVKVRAKAIIAEL